MSETKEPKIEEPKIEEPKTLINKIEKNEQTLVDELNDIEKKKQSIHDNIHELSTFYMKLKGDLLKKEKNIEEKRQQILIDKEKLKQEAQDLKKKTAGVLRDVGTAIGSRLSLSGKYREARKTQRKFKADAARLEADKEIKEPEQ